MCRFCERGLQFPSCRVTLPFTDRQPPTRVPGSVAEGREIASPPRGRREHPPVAPDPKAAPYAKTMNDSPNLPEPSGAGDQPPARPATNGSPSKPSGSNGAGTPAARRAVRSGLAHRRNPVLARLSEVATTARRVAFRDPQAQFQQIATIEHATTILLQLG